MKKIFLIFLLVGTVGCAGEDYNPVYFPGSQSESTTPPPAVNPSISKAKCHVKLTAKLCVKIKGEKIEVGTGAESPLCADTPAIPLEIEGEKIALKGGDFPDIQVSVDIRGVATPMVINGKGATDGSQNEGIGTWTPSGEINIKGFSFFINVLGMSGEIPGLDLTTDTTQAVSSLPALKGKPASADGKILLATATTLGSLFPAADAYLLGASMQATFDGTIKPTLSECAETTAGEKEIVIVKLRKMGSNPFREEPLPEENILEISQGTFIAQGAQDVGPNFEATAEFKATNNGKKGVEIEIPSALGPFFFSVNGKTKKMLEPKKSVQFQITFKPDTANTPEAGSVRQNFSLGNSQFYLSAVALDPAGRVLANRVDDAGETTSANIQAVTMDPLSVPAVPVRKYFHCRSLACEGEAHVIQCRPCGADETTGCTLQTVDSDDHPIEEVSADCRPLHPESAPRMNLNLSGTTQIPMRPSKQVVTLQNGGVTDLVIQKISIEEVPNSKSKGQFQFSVSRTVPFTLPPLADNPQARAPFVTATYLPTDLIGFDGRQATNSEPATDMAYLSIETNSGTQKITLTGKTKIEETAPLQVVFGTATGMKSKTSLDTFSFEEITTETENLAYPVFLNLNETASAGIRISEIKIGGEDQGSFEWLDSQEKVNARQPASGHGKRCSIPVFDPATGRMIDERFDLNFVAVGSQGFDLKPGAFSSANPPLFGCINFHPSTSSGQVPKKIFNADLTVTGLSLDAAGRVLRNPDGSHNQTSLVIHLAAALSPLKGKMVLRIPQTIAAILNPTSPSLTAVAAKKEVDMMIRDGRGSNKESVVLMGALILDPFDEMSITSARGNVISEPGDGITSIFRALETRPASTRYTDEHLFDYATLSHDSDLGEYPGIFSDYDFPDHPLPNPLKINGWRIFTGALSYPGPLSPRSPVSREECEDIDPCSTEGLRQFTESGIGADGKGACAFFFASGGRYHSPAFEPVINGQNSNLCEHRDQPQEILDMDTGHYSVDGTITFEDLGLRFWGPTYVHNPYGPLGFKPPLDEVFHVAFTTEILKPSTGPGEYNVLPDEKIDIGRQEYKINLTESDFPTPAICPKNMHNRHLGGRTYSSWRYFAPLLFKDETGETPAGCPEEGSSFTGGTAYLKGRRLDPETKTLTMVMGAKFGNREDLSLAFKDVMIFVALNGWICDPQGSEENFEGAKCFDLQMNARDEKAQISIVGE